MIDRNQNYAFKKSLLETKYNPDLQVKEVNKQNIERFIPKVTVEHLMKSEKKQWTQIIKKQHQNSYQTENKMGNLQENQNMFYPPRQTGESFFQRKESLPDQCQSTKLRPKKKIILVQKKRSQSIKQNKSAFQNEHLQHINTDTVPTADKIANHNSSQQTQSNSTQMTNFQQYRNNVSLGIKQIQTPFVQYKNKEPYMQVQKQNKDNNNNEGDKFSETLKNLFLPNIINPQTARKQSGYNTEIQDIDQQIYSARYAPNKQGLVSQTTAYNSSINNSPDKKGRKPSNLKTIVRLFRTENSNSNKQKFLQCLEHQQKQIKQQNQQNPETNINIKDNSNSKYHTIQTLEDEEKEKDKSAMNQLLKNIISKGQKIKIKNTVYSPSKEKKNCLKTQGKIVSDNLEYEKQKIDLKTKLTDMDLKKLSATHYAKIIPTELDQNKIPISNYQYMVKKSDRKKKIVMNFLNSNQMESMQQKDEGIQTNFSNDFMDIMQSEYPEQAIDLTEEKILSTVFESQKTLENEKQYQQTLQEIYGEQEYNTMKPVLKKIQENYV